MSEILVKVSLLLIGLSVGYGVFRNRENVKSIISGIVFNCLLPYVIFMEVSSMALTPYWWSYSLMGAAFILVPFFVGQILFRLSQHKSILLATAEGGTMGFAIYATIGSEPLARFFLVDMIGNGLSLFLIIFPILMQGRREWNRTFLLFVFAIVTGILANFAGFHPLQGDGVLTLLEPWLVALLVLLIAIIVGAGVVIKTSKEIFASKFFTGFWFYRMAFLAVSLYMEFPLAVTILAILPPSFMLPIFYRTQKQGEEAEYASSFIASCLPVSIILAAYLIAR